MCDDFIHFFQIGPRNTTKRFCENNRENLDFCRILRRNIKDYRLNKDMRHSRKAMAIFKCQS
uniref:Uncharacterized protein n=1 Tax=Romanomermis culicivorax TaxID=13658 RepID=A0A915IJ77_ROMCU